MLSCRSTSDYMGVQIALECSLMLDAFDMNEMIDIYIS